ncbi:MAG TPA: glycyl radical-activating protein, partial [Aquifex aeolicus]|nr:glycyl radical-activating protein [Aquifex aeolicus]
MGLKFSAYAYSTKDVPGKWSLVLFLPFCNFMCRHCHNWRLVLGREKN